jgi:hypothetical protein
MSHAVGSVLAERLLEGRTHVPHQRLKLLQGMLADRPRGTFPGIERVASKFDEWSFDRVFETGLQSLVAGLDESAPRRKRYRRPAGTTSSHRS